MTTTIKLAPRSARDARAASISAAAVNAAVNAAKTSVENAPRLTVVDGIDLARMAKAAEKAIRWHVGAAMALACENPDLAINRKFVEGASAIRAAVKDGNLKDGDGLEWGYATHPAHDTGNARMRFTKAECVHPPRGTETNPRTETNAAV